MSSPVSLSFSARSPCPSIFTQAVHAGERAAAPIETPVTTPIYHSAGFLEPSAARMDAVFAGEEHGYVYRRYGSPTVEAFERAVAALEGGETAFATASGMAAVHAALLAAGVRTGSAVVAAQDCYGATYSLLSTLLTEQGAAVAFVDTTDLAQVRAALAQHRPVALLIETISNPLLKLADIASAGRAGPRRGRSADRGQHLCHPLPLPAA
ncbi:MAG: PLP-dependent transferase [Anaerolineae bacterium]